MNTDLKTAAAYIRVSTSDQTELSPDSQIKVVQQYAKQHGFIIPKQFIFRDDGISGRHADKRPEFNAMIAAAKQKPAPFSAVLLWKFSRFARNQEESIFYKSMLRKNGIEVISISEPVIEGPFGTLIERIIEWSDEYYSIRLSGEVKRGMTEKVERGGAVSIPAFGYNIENKQYVINPETAPIVQKVFADYLNGSPLIQIARNMNALGIKTTRGNNWENRTVEYMLRNPVYIGKIRWNPKRRTRRNYDDPDIMVVDGTHEPIIETETFEKVQALIEEQKKRYSKYAHPDAKSNDYMLRSLVKCSNCGGSLTMAVKGTSLQCCKYIHGKCDISHYISFKKINQLVIDTIDAAFKTEDFDMNIKSKRPSLQENYINVEALIEKERNKFNRVREAYTDGIYTLDELKEFKKASDERISALKMQAEPTQNNISQMKKALIEKNKNIISTLKNPNISEKEKNELLLSFVDKIIFNRATGTIRVIFYA